MGLEQKEIAQIQNTSWELDCCQIRLIRNSSTESFEGPGYIKSTPNGKLSFKLYCTTGIEPDQGMTWWAERSSGKIIPNEKCYHLTATDVQGRRWEADNILPYHGGALTEENTAISGNINALKSTDKVESLESESSLAFVCFDEYEIPWNTGTRKYEDQNGQPVEIGGSMDTAKFRMRDFDFSMANRDGRFSVNIITKNFALINEHTEFKLVEALMFVLGRPINWTIFGKRVKSTATIVIRPTRDSKRFINPPLRFPNPTTSDYWELYAKYFDYVCSQPDNSLWHPISILLHRVIEVQQSSLENKCLILSVAIEGILLNSLADLAKPTDIFLEQLGKVKEALTNLGMPDGLSKRFKGTVNSMKRASASDKLRGLLKLGIITDKEFKTWKSIRNSSTHPEKAFFDDFEEAFDNFDIMLTMCYKIIFYCIGYSGLYTDYSPKDPVDKRFQIPAS